MRETTALGAAIAAGLAVGVWRNFVELRDINRAGGAVFEPQVSRQESATKFAEWEKAVRMSRGWVGCDKAAGDDEINKPTPSAVKQNELSPSLTVHNPDHSFVSEVVKGPVVNESTNRTTHISVKEIEFHSAPRSLVNIVRDLDGMDEEDLLLELRKVEILQRLKKLKKMDYY
jgi:glycerol kinase